jgi:thioredoxin 1
MAKEITDSNFIEITSTDKLTVVDFWAPWCGPCKVLSPIIDELSEEYSDNVVIGKVNIEDSDELTTEFRIRSVPTIIFLKNKEIVFKHSGSISKEQLEEKIKELM